MHTLRLVDEDGRRAQPKANSIDAVRVAKIKDRTRDHKDRGDRHTSICPERRRASMHGWAHLKYHARRLGNTFAKRRMPMRFFGAVLMFAVATIATAAQAPRATPQARVPSKPSGTLAQVMRGIYFPNSNIIFDVQQNDPAAPKKKTGDTGSATEAYSNAYSGWDAVENAAVALTDSVDLILTPGRLCQNGKPVPSHRADFQKFARDMREAGRAVLAAARTRNQEKVSDATNNLADACSSCHEAYRDTGAADSASRCTAPLK
jgi:hypothetical protein